MFVFLSPFLLKIWTSFENICTLVYTWTQTHIQKNVHKHTENQAQPRYGMRQVCD